MLTRSKEFYRQIKRRHSVREFSSRGVSKEVIEQCIRAVGTAPSGANHQPWHFAIIGSPTVRKEIRKKAEKEERRFYEMGKAGEE